MDWDAFDDIRERWEAQHDRAQASQLAALDDLRAHIAAWVMVSSAAWLLCFAAGGALQSPALLTAAWGCFVLVHVMRFREAAPSRARHAATGPAPLASPLPPRGGR